MAARRVREQRDNLRWLLEQTRPMLREEAKTQHTAMPLRDEERRWAPWIVPLFYAAAAVAAGIFLPRLENRFLPGFFSPMSASAAMAIYSSIASGMIALTGIVFSLTF